MTRGTQATRYSQNFVGGRKTNPGAFFVSKYVGVQQLKKKIRLVDKRRHRYGMEPPESPGSSGFMMWTSQGKKATLQQRRGNKTLLQISKLVQLVRGIIDG